MPSRDDLKRSVLDEIDRRGEELIRVAKTIRDHPEPGFREIKTAAVVDKVLGNMGVARRGGIAITGIKGYLEGGAGPGPTIGVMGELDSLLVPGHPYADASTGAAHACGHHAQIAMMLGVGMGMQATGVMDALTGRVALIAVPAEEYIEVEYRNSLRQQGKLGFLAGKAEFLRLGEFDDVDLAMMTHTSSNTDEGKLTISSTNNGMIAKFIQFQGKAAHAGNAPHLGINALNAATLALSNIHAQRETFQDKDTVRVHPIITMGGASVNSVPADVRMETFVRGNNLEAIADADAKVDRSLRAGAMAVGATVNITTLPGYMPMNNDDNMMSVYRGNAAYVVGKENVGNAGHRNGSTDMGDLGHVIPTIHPYSGGAIGTGHGDDYLIQDWDNAVLNAAKAMALTVVDLLADGAIGAKEIKSKHRPRMSINEYVTVQTDNLRVEAYTP